MFWRQLKLVPRHALNGHLLYSVLVFGLMGAARGLDEGTIAGTMTQPSFIAQFGLKDPSKTQQQLANLKSNIASMVQVGCIAGAIVGFAVLDLIGRKRSLQFLCIIWIVGSIIQITSFSGVGQLYAGRFIAGIGIGMTSVCCPTYIVEVAPAPIRGLCTCLYSGSVYLGIMIGYFANWGTMVHISNTNRDQWVIPNSLQLILAGIGLVASIFVIESPRWLLKVHKPDKAIHNLCTLRHLPLTSKYIDEEMSSIYLRLSEERPETSDSTEPSPSLSPAMPDISKPEADKHVPFSFARHSHPHSHSHSHWVSTTAQGMISNIKIFRSCKYQLFLCLAIQLLAQWTGSNAVTIYAPEFFTMVGIENQNTKMLATSMFGVTKFVASIACALIIIDYFGRKRALYSGITLQFISTLYLGVFLAIKNLHHVSKSSSPSFARAGSGAVAMIYINGVGWALGWNSIQYLINAEVFPLQARSMAASLVMCFHFINQYANSKALPSMLLSMNDWGAMIFFAVVSLAGMIFAWFFIPEAAGLELEQVEYLFSRKWYKVGRTKLGNESKPSS